MDGLPRVLQTDPCEISPVEDRTWKRRDGMKASLFTEAHLTFVLRPAADVTAIVDAWRRSASVSMAGSATTTERGRRQCETGQWLVTQEGQWTHQQRSRRC